MLTPMIEALIFASGKAIRRQDIYDGLKEQYSRKEIDRSIAELIAKYSGDCGIHILEIRDTLQMQNNSEYGDILADILKETREKELSKTLLQVLAIIVYKQPITRTEIEDIRGSSPDYVMGMLLKFNLIEPKGRKEALGHPILYGTTDEFLKKFGISDITELPEYEDIMYRIRNNYDKYHAKSAGLYRDVKELDEDEEETEESGENLLKDEFLKNQQAENEAAAAFDDDQNSEENPSDDEGADDANDVDDDDIPDFLSGEDILTVE